MSPKRTWAEIDLGAIEENFDAIRARVGPNVRIMGVVKADAYGHGAVPVARVLAAKGAAMFGVATPDEAIELRRAGIRQPVLMFGAILPEEIPFIIRNKVSVTLSDLSLAREVSRQAGADNKVGVHLKVDTGMGRLGVSESDAVETAVALARLPGIRLEGVCTHFPTSDESDLTFTSDQTRRFRGICAEMERRGVRVPLCHAANSGAVLGFPDAHLDMVRPGIMMYGLYPSPECERTVALKPALALKSRIVFMRTVAAGQAFGYGRAFTARGKMKVAILPIGYNDGFNRLNSNRGAVLVRGRRVSVVGRVCMDQAFVDVTDVPGAAVGDEVVLYGAQGNESMSVEEVAQRLGTIPNEVVCAVGKRVPRVYTRGAAVSASINGGMA